MKDVRSIDSNKLRIQAEPLVSIVIPCYNYGLFISQTLDCLLTQSYQNWEAIIVDDGSTDETQQVVSQYVKRDHRFVYIHQINQGPSVARNTGLKNAKGVYIHFLDSDDLLSREKLTAQVSYMEHNRDCDISYTDAYYFEDKKPNELFKNWSLTEKTEKWIPQIHARGQQVLPYLIRSNIMPIDAPLIRSDFLLKHNLYFDELYHSVEDWEFWLRCAYNNASFEYFDSEVAHVLIRVHPNSLTQNSAKMYAYEIKLRHDTNAYLNQLSGVKYLHKINDKNLHSLLYKETLWQHNRISYAGVQDIIKQIGWMGAIKFIIRELNIARKTRIT